MQPTRHVPDRDRLSVLTAVILLAFALTRFLDLPTRSLTAILFGSPLGIDIDVPVLMMLLVAALISAGSDTLIRSHPAAQTPGRSTIIHWVLPGTAALVLAAVLNRAPDGPLWWLGLGLSAIALLLVLVAEYVSVDPADPNWDLATLGLTALAYALALLLFALLRSLSTRALIAAPIGGVAAAGLALRLFVLRSGPGHDLRFGRALLYAGLVGAVAGEALWALNYWRVAPSSAGLLAMIPFYIGVGVAQQHLAGRLTARVWVEYVVVGALGVAIALAYAFV